LREQHGAVRTQDHRGGDANDGAYAASGVTA